MNISEIFPAGFDTVMSSIIAANAKAAPVKKVRAGLLDEAKAALEAGKPLPALIFESKANYSYNAHAARMHGLYVMGDRTALEAIEVSGVNTYARALKGYHALLLAALKPKPAEVVEIAAKKPKAKKIAASKKAA